MKMTFLLFCVVIFNDTRFFSTYFAVHCCLVWCVGVPQSFFTVHNECGSTFVEPLKSKKKYQTASEIPFEYVWANWKVATSDAISSGNIERILLILFLPNRIRRALSGKIRVIFSVRELREEIASEFSPLLKKWGSCWGFFSEFYVFFLKSCLVTCCWLEWNWV